MYRSLMVIDDFYPDPMQIRAAALAADYVKREGHLTFPGRNSVQKFIPPGLDLMMSRLLGEKVVSSNDPRPTHGKFRITLAGEPSRYLVHVDPSILSWVGVIYLNPPEQCQGGTSFYRHKGLNSDRTPLSLEELRAYGPNSIAELLEQDGANPDIWEHLMTVPMRFNRLIAYRPWIWHSAGPAFGDSLETGRLVQLVGFEAAA